MKKIFIPLVTSFIIISCGGDRKTFESVIESGNLSEIRAMKEEIASQQNSIASKMEQLNQAISKLDTAKKIPLVTTFSAKSEVFNHYLELQGNVMTKQNVIVYPEMNGLLTNVYVKDGQMVSKGQILARIDDGGLGRQVAQMQIQADLSMLNKKGQNYERMNKGGIKWFLHFQGPLNVKKYQP